MNVFYEEDGGFKVGAVLSESEASYQVEAAHGKRSKIKAANVLLKFETPGLNAFMAGAEAGAADIDLDFLWEVAPGEEFGYAELGVPRRAAVHLREALGFGGPMQITNLFVSLHTQLDKFLLPRFVNLAAVTPYELGFRVVTAAAGPSLQRESVGGGAAPPSSGALP